MQRAPERIILNGGTQMLNLEEHEGVVLRVNEQGLGIIEDKKSHEHFVFTFDKISSYRGEKPQEIGLRVGAQVRFSATADTGIVASVELIKP